MSNKEMKTMLKNLRTALDNKGITIRAYAAVLGISEKSVQNKINEVTPFTYPEAMKTMKDVFPEYNSAYLFEAEKEVI